MQSEDPNLRIVEQIKHQLGTNLDIEQGRVKGHLLQLHVKQALYHRLISDRERGRKIVITLMQEMKRLTGSTDVTVWIYSENEKVIEGKVKDWGGDNVKYLYDL